MCKRHIHMYKRDIHMYKRDIHVKGCAPTRRFSGAGSL